MARNDIPDRIARSFAAQGLMEVLGARLLSAGSGRAVIAAPVRRETSQQHGFAHAGLTFAIGDSAAGYAALSEMPEDREVLTVEMKIQLLAPAKGDRLLAEGAVIKAGRRLSVVQSHVFAETGDTRRLVALLNGTMIPVEPG